MTEFVIILTAVVLTTTILALTTMSRRPRPRRAIARAGPRHERWR